MMESSEILKKILLHMKYDSKKTLSENKIILNEAGPTPLTFNGPNPSNLSQTVKYVTVGKILSKVSDNLSTLKEFEYKDNVMTLKHKKHFYYPNSDALIRNHESKLTNCISETYSNGRVKSWDPECRNKYFKTLDALNQKRHTYCLSKIINNQALLNMPFAIQVSGTKMDQYGESSDGVYKIMFFLNGDDCTFGGLNYYHDSGYENFLNTDYELKPLNIELIQKPKEQPKPVVKKIVQKSETPKLTLDQQKKWCADHGKVWDEDTNTCQFAEVTVKPNENKIKSKDGETINKKGDNLMPGIGSNAKGMGEFSFDLEL